jgi:hypothetical protein
MQLAIDTFIQMMQSREIYIIIGGIICVFLVDKIRRNK